MRIKFSDYLNTAFKSFLDSDSRCNNLINQISLTKAFFKDSVASNNDPHDVVDVKAHASINYYYQHIFIQLN